LRIAECGFIVGLVIVDCRFDRGSSLDSNNRSDDQAANHGDQSASYFDSKHIA